MAPFASDYGLTATPSDHAIAADCILAAENDLGPLSDGQRRDLLMDNTSFTSERIRQLVDDLRDLGRS